MTTDIKTHLCYVKDEKLRPYIYQYNRSDEERKANPHHKSDKYLNSSLIETLVKDARSLGMSLTANGFQLFQQTTNLTKEDFYKYQVGGNYVKCKLRELKIMMIYMCYCI